MLQDLLAWRETEERWARRWVCWTKPLTKNLELISEPFLMSPVVFPRVFTQGPPGLPGNPGRNGQVGKRVRVLIYPGAESAWCFYVLLFISDINNIASGLNGLCSLGVRVNTEQTVAVEKLEMQDQRWGRADLTGLKLTFQLFFFLLTSLLLLSPFPQGDRGFDGLPGLPGHKGHKVSCLLTWVNAEVSQWQHYCLFC